MRGLQTIKSRQIIVFKVQLVNTGEVFDSLKDAGLAYNVASTHIVACCKGKRKSAGKLNGVKMVWKYV